MSLGKGIKLSTGFDLNSQSPLDNREVFETIRERDSLPRINLYEGLHCYVKETKKNYQYIDGSWVDFAVSSDGIVGGTVSSLPEIEYGDEEPTDGNIMLWVDTSADEGVSSLLTDSFILEIRNSIQSLNSQIDKLKSENIALEKRIAYLENNVSFGGNGGGNGGNDNDDDTNANQLIFEDGTILTFEDGSIMTFE